MIEGARLSFPRDERLAISRWYTKTKPIIDSAGEDNASGETEGSGERQDKPSDRPVQ